MALTEEQIKKYIACPVNCPYCDSDDIFSDPVDISDDSADVECYACGKTWKDIWTITDIQEDEEELEDSSDEPDDPHEHDLSVSERL
jgi:Zn ribbon nucleic-acid-binding protein